MSSKIYTVGILGLGRAGWDIHAQDVRQHPRFRIAAMSDPLPERCREAESVFNVPGSSDLAGMLDSVELDAVVVATPTLFHYDQAKQVLKAGKLCILEKPMTLNFAQAESLFQTAASGGGRLVVHHNHLFRPLVHHLKEIIAQNLIGPVIEVQVFWGGYSRRNDWQALRRNGGGVLFNYGSHLLSILLPLLDEPVADVECDAATLLGAGDAEDHVHLRLHMASGRRAETTISSCAALPGQRWIILGKNGALTTDGVNSRIKYYDPAEIQPPQMDAALAARERKYFTESLPWQELNIPSIPANHPPKFYDCLAGVLDGTPQPLLDSAIPLQIMETLEKARVAAKL